MRQACVPALFGFVLMLAVGAFALAAGEPLLFPSLGPTVFIQVHEPHSKAARPWNTLVGHAVGIAAAVLAMVLTGATHTPPPVVSGILTWQRELASALAVGLTIVAQIPLKAQHAPATSTALLITLGAIDPEWHAVTVIAAGVVLTTILERLARPWLMRAMHEPGHAAKRGYSGS